MSQTDSKPALSPEQQAAVEAIRARSKIERPGPDELIDSGELDELVPHGQFMELRQLTVHLRQIRERQGLSLTDVSERSGMTRAAISRLENGWNLNPTLDTLFRYATVLGAKSGSPWKNARRQDPDRLDRLSRPHFQRGSRACKRGSARPGKSRSRGRFWPNGWRSERRTNHETEAGSLLIAERVGSAAQEEGGTAPTRKPPQAGSQFRPARDQPVATRRPTPYCPRHGSGKARVERG